MFNAANPMGLSRGARPAVHRPVLALLLVAAAAPAQIWEREEIRFEKIDERARALAAAPYQAPRGDLLPAWMRDLTADQYRDIRFRADRAIWKAESLPFQLMLFHPGHAFREPASIHEITQTHAQLVRFSPDFFEYGPLVSQRGDMPADVGYGGLRLHAPLNQAGVFDELLVLQGGSSWRALGAGQRYGLSSRGVAIDTGLDGRTEEFPSFRQFWARKPEAGAKAVELFALLDGPSVAGAYQFVVTPGKTTTVDVRLSLYPRRAITRLGIAPMASMFWFGENSRRRFDDFRPEVHDSDGLAIRTSDGQRIWRPLTNDPGRTEFSFFAMPKPGGFGLLQRDRRPEAYEDSEAAYQQRPSLWIQPTNDWGPGRVMLMEASAASEQGENIVALWEPSTPPQAGQRLEFAYRQHWTTEGDPSQAGGRVVATRTGTSTSRPEQRTVVIDFAGGTLDTLPADRKPEAVVALQPDGEGSKLRILHAAVQPLPDKRWRASFVLAPAAEGGRLADSGSAELTCCLKAGADFLTETWAYRITP